MIKHKRIQSIIILILFTSVACGQKVEEFELTDNWIDKIEMIIPERLSPEQVTNKKVLIFSLHTGFKHWTIPHTEAVIKLIAEKSAGFEVVTSKDIAVFEKEKLSQFDAVVLNNTCSKGDHRNLFFDVFQEDSNLSKEQQKIKAKELEQNLIAFVDNGKGLMVMHGGIVTLNKSKDFGKVLGGSFDYHPRQQDIKIKLTEPDHPMLSGFEPEGFTHFDEPYFFKDAYYNFDFKPLLYMEISKIKGQSKKVEGNVHYISWIKSYGKGKVFYCSPSHNAQSMENPALLQYFLNGMLYVTHQLDCDDSPIKKSTVSN